MKKKCYTVFDRQEGLKQTMANQIDMLHGSLVKKLLLFALPLAATGTVQQLFNAADGIILGHFAGSDALAAVGSTAPIINLSINLFIGLSAFLPRVMFTQADAAPATPAPHPHPQHG